MRRITFFLIILFCVSNLNAQSELKSSINSLQSEGDTVILSPDEAFRYIKELVDMNELWSQEGDTLKLSLSRLIGHYQEPFDSVENRLEGFQNETFTIVPKEILRRDSLQIRWLNDSTFIVDSLSLEKEPFITTETITRRLVDTTSITIRDSLSITSVENDTLLSLSDTTASIPGSISRVSDTLINRGKPVTLQVDTVRETYIDSLYLRSRGLTLYRFKEGEVQPPILPEESQRSVSFSSDSRSIVLSDTLSIFVTDEQSPFNILPGLKLPDSLRSAVKTLLKYTNQRDSILIHFTGVKGRSTPFWLTTGKDELYRYWVKNYNNDSITIWMGNPSRHRISMTLEEDVNLKRLEKETFADIPISMVKPAFSLAKVEPLEEIPVYWNYDFSSSFILNQTFLSNWSKGGENAFSSLIDIEGSAEYTDTKSETKWTNTGRIKLGTIITEDKGWRTNTDMFELNSKYNKVIREKIDFSSVFYFKTQLARGFNYPKDTAILVSKFLNPGTFTVGLGLEYKPFKKTTVNFAPLSYKNTFVLDTANIDQTQHGIAGDKKARQEMGGQLVVKNKLELMEDLSISNSLRLFSGYLNKPQNIDVDWEMNIDKRINWYFRILLNLHLIYDDDVLFPVLDDNNQPVKLPDGSDKKVPKTQFKQFLGLTFSFKF